LYCSFIICLNCDSIDIHAYCDRCLNYDLYDLCDLDDYLVQTVIQDDDLV